MKSKIQEALGVIVGLHPGLRGIKRNGLTIFAFHDVSENPSAFASEYGLAATSTQFRAQIDWILAHYAPIHPDQLLQNCALPSDAALITFDDGWRGALKDGCEILRHLKVPSIHFLNFGAVESGILCSSIAAYFNRNIPSFADFAADRGMHRPFHLSLRPSDLAAVDAKFGRDWREQAAAYQGRIATADILAAAARDPLVVFGSHGYLHWNAAALSDEEFSEDYRRNEARLASYANARPFYAFANGVPPGAYRERHIATVVKLGARRVFAAKGGMNSDAQAVVLDRIALTPWHHSTNRLAYAIGRQNWAGPPDISGAEAG